MTFVTDYEHTITAITWIFEKLAAKNISLEKWVETFLNPKYVSKVLSE